MSNVYLAIPGAPDRLLGHVHNDGQVYRSQAGLDDLVGHADLATGAVYQQRFGPDKKVGRVDLSDGRVYVSRLGPDTYVGQVHADGRMRLHQPLGVDDYIARVDEFLSYAHAAAALLLLVMPFLEAEPASESPEEAPTNSDSQS